MAAAFGAAIHGDVLTNGREWADNQFAAFAPVFHILRRAADDREGVDFAALSDLGPACDNGVGVDLRVLAERDVRADDRERPNLHAIFQYRPPVYSRRRMHHHLGHGSIIRSLGIGRIPAPNRRSSR